MCQDVTRKSNKQVLPSKDWTGGSARSGYKSRNSAPYPPEEVGKFGFRFCLDLTND